MVRDIGNPDEFFAAHRSSGSRSPASSPPDSYRLTAYIVDVQRQFADRDDHLGVFGELLGRIAARPPIDIEPGSDRSPDY